jgi:hypothetical protein
MRPTHAIPGRKHRRRSLQEVVMNRRWTDRDNALFAAVFERQPGMPVRLLCDEYNRCADAAAAASDFAGAAAKTVKQIEGKLRRKRGAAQAECGEAGEDAGASGDRNVVRRLDGCSGVASEDEMSRQDGEPDVPEAAGAPGAHQDARFLDMDDAEFEELLRFIDYVS